VKFPCSMLHHVSRVRERKEEEEGGGGVKGIYNPVS
jgi:hypothetical protein